MLQTLRWWLRGIRYLRFPVLVRGLGELKTQWETVDAVREEYKTSAVKIHREVVLENWAPGRLSLDEAVTIERGTILCWGHENNKFGHIQIGAHSWIGPNNNFRTSGEGSIRMGRRCLVSQFCSFVSHNHGTNRDTAIQLQLHSSTKENIVIGDDVWFGVGCCVMPGVHVGSGAVIGAGAVVTRSVPEYEIWAGVPASRIGLRK